MPFDQRGCTTLRGLIDTLQAVAKKHPQWMDENLFIASATEVTHAQRHQWDYVDSARNLQGVLVDSEGISIVFSK